MRRFSRLYDSLDRTTSTREKVTALARYFREAPPADAAWALFFLSGQRLKRLVPAASLWTWLEHASGLPRWLLADAHESTGDVAETITLVLDDPPTEGDGRGAQDGSPSLARWIEERILPLRAQGPDAQERAVTGWWRSLDRQDRFVLTKLLTGELRVGVSQTLVVRALAQGFDLPVDVVAHRIMGQWQPTPAFFASVVAPIGAGADPARPYPFFLASPLDREATDLGAREAWLAEWKWDGIRAQVIRRSGRTFIWSRGEELLTDRFPELLAPASRLADGTVIDAEIVVLDGERPLPFAVLQRRIGRQKLTAAVLRDAPAGLIAYDLLEDGGADIREQPLAERRARLERHVPVMGGPCRISAALDARDWAALAALRSESRSHAAEGLMLKRLASPYGVGRRVGDWWKWKIAPYTVDAVLMYAQPGSGRRSTLFTDYTFGLWRGDELVPFAKAYSGLTDAEILELDRWIRRHATERFGPVRHVEPRQVFELGFDGLSRSTRHRSGIAVRFPRILRWRRDKAARDADTMATIESLVDGEV